MGGCIEHFNTSTGHYCHNMILTWHDDIVIFHLTADILTQIQDKISYFLDILDYRCVDFYCSEVTKVCVFAYTNYGEKFAHNWDINDLKKSKRSTSYCHCMTVNSQGGLNNPKITLHPLHYTKMYLWGLSWTMQSVTALTKLFFSEFSFRNTHYSMTNG